MKSWRSTAAVSVGIHLLVFGLMFRLSPLSPAPKHKVREISLRLRASPPEPQVTPPPEPPQPPPPKPPPQPPKKAKRRPKPNRPKPPKPTKVETPAPPPEPKVAPPILRPKPPKPERDLQSLDLSPRLSVPKFENQGPGVQVPKPRADPRLRRKKGGRLEFNDTSFKAEIDVDGSVTFDGRGYRENVLDGKPRQGYPIDINDWLISAVTGKDPYSYEKRKFLDRTREMRLAMARKVCGERLSRALIELPERLNGVWNHKSLPVEIRKERLFKMWDECAEEGSPQILRYSQLVRMTIIAFIGKHLPAGSAYAYTPGELQQFNRKRYSKVRFEPYRASTN